jgi:hypothetical protein
MAVYLSYARQNVGAAFKLSEALDRRQVKTWADFRELGGLSSGADWSEQIKGAIQAADAFVFLIGPPGMDDRPERFEWECVVEEEYYLDPDKPMIPVVIGGADLPGFLNARKSFAADPSSLNFEAIADFIAASIQKPGDTIDPEKIERGRKARDLALRKLGEYNLQLEEEDAKRAGLRGMK